MSKQNQHKPNVPKLRFPEFSGEWEEKKVKDEFKVVSGSTPLRSKKEYYDNKGIPWIKTMDLNNSELYTASERVSELAVKELKLKILPKNTILIAMYGGFNQIGRTGLLTFESTINQAISALLDINQQHNSRFFQSYFNRNVNKWRRYAASSRKDPNITKKDIEGFKIIFPTYTEQQKIGSFFNKLNQQIELEEKKLALLEEQKKGYMQKIFSQELRFKDENGNDYPEWEVSSLGKIAHVTKGFTPSTKNDDFWEESKYNWLSIAGLNKKYITKGNKGITQAAVGNKKMVPKNTLVMSFKLTIGKLAVLKEELYTNEAICHLNWTNEEVNTEFVYYYLNMVNISSFGAQAIKGITLNNESINSIVIKLPKYQEQLKIADFLRKIDMKIELHKKKVQLLSRKKYSLLQSMFL